MTKAQVIALLKARHLQQADLAKICKVSQATISRVISGNLYSRKVWNKILRIAGKRPLLAGRDPFK